MRSDVSSAVIGSPRASCQTMRNYPLATRRTDPPTEEVDFLASPQGSILRLRGSLAVIESPRDTPRSGRTNPILLRRSSGLVNSYRRLHGGGAQAREPAWGTLHQTRIAGTGPAIRTIGMNNAAEGSVFRERGELAGVRGVAQLAQRLGLDLADALAGDAEHFSDLLEGVVGHAADAEPHAQDLLLA